MKHVYTIFTVLLVVTGILVLAETFDVLVPPMWLSQTNGMVLVLSLFMVVFIRVRRAVPRHR